MFDNLIESKAKRQKRFGGTAFSFVFHAVLIAAAVQGTLKASNKLEKLKAEKVEFVQVKKEEPPPPKEQPKVEVPPDVVASPQPPKGFQILSAPIEVARLRPDLRRAFRAQASDEPLLLVRLGHARRPDASSPPADGRASPWGGSWASRSVSTSAGSSSSRSSRSPS